MTRAMSGTTSLAQNGCGTLALLVALGCVLQPALPRPVPQPAPAPVSVVELPPIPVQSIVGDSALRVQPVGSRITLTSSNADLRDLLPLLATAAGVDLVMGPEVRGRVSVRFQNVRAIDALMAVIEQAGLTVGETWPDTPLMKPVFYDLPVNVNFASAATIRARFDVTPRLAEWLVKGRTF